MEITSIKSDCADTVILYGRQYRMNENKEKVMAIRLTESEHKYVKDMADAKFNGKVSALFSHLIKTWQNNLIRNECALIDIDKSTGKFCKSIYCQSCGDYKKKMIENRVMNKIIEEIEDDVKNNADLLVSRLMIENKEKWRDWIYKIPYLNFPEKYQVKLIPPYCGAMVRFFIKNPKTDKQVSIYLDCFERIGFYSTDDENKEYWELYPDDDDDVFRCGMNETEILMNKIKEILK
jgi:hypothetical protein